MKRFISSLIMSALLLAGVSTPLHAATRASQTSVGSAVYRNSLFWSTTYTVDSSMTSEARVGPISGSSAGFGAQVAVTKIPGTNVASLPRIPVSGSATRATVQTKVDQWYSAYSSPFLTQMASWLKAKGISHGYFSFAQEVQIGTKRNQVVWSGIVNSTGSGAYGSLQILDATPIYVDATYWSKKPSEDIPPGWEHPSAGTVQWRLLDYKFDPLTAFTTVQTQGEFDTAEGANSSSQVACFVDLRNPGCAGPLDVRKLVVDNEAAGALVTYVEKLSPRYTETPDPSDSSQSILTPARAYSYEDRLWECTSLLNKGYMGYVLETTVNQYFATPAEPVYRHSLVGQRALTTLSETTPFSVVATKEQLQGQHPGNVLLSPFPDAAIWQLNSPEAAKATYVAPIRVNPAAGLEDVTAMSGDVYVAKNTYGSITDYTIGTPGDNYFGAGGFVNTVRFNLTGAAALSQFTLLSAYFDDWFLIELNGHLMFIGPNLPYTVGETGAGLFYPTAWPSCTEGVCATPTGSFDLFFGTATAPRQMCFTIFSTPFCFYTNYGFSGGFVSGWELGRTWGAAPMTDMRPWLKEGVNELRMTLLVGGRGEYWFYVREDRNTCGDTLGIPPNTAPPAGTTSGTVKDALTGQF